MDADVIVVGAGPTGLALANELELAGARVAVLDRLAARSPQSKALNLQPRTAELLDARGWLAPIADRAVANIPGGHFAGLRLDYSVFDTRFPYQVGIPQGRVEEALEARLAGAGIPVSRGTELLRLEQDADGVTLTVGGPEGERTLRAAYAVGADGGRSRVRKELGVAFPGRDGRVSMAVADVVLAEDPRLPTEWRIPNLEPSASRSGFLIPLEDNAYRFVFAGQEQQGLGRDAPITEEEVRAALHDAHGDAAKLLHIRHASRFTDASRQAEHYRTGRVFLAGDAAHIHSPAGGQGLNLGVQDAFNLGWKLGAAVAGWATDGLLDTYHAERHPVAARVLQNTRAQGVLMVPDPDVLALRAITAELAATPDGNRLLAGMISGLEIRYDMPDGPAHPLLGARLPDVELHSGRGLLLGGPPGIADGWRGRVDHTPGDPGDVRLVRPDGYVCFAGHPEELHDALARWFGAPAVA
ncbi:FAD-dependent monooxygenase [Amycolatopsis sp. NPDC059021]|uniref:FAD-dependent monooxygenase n=1 Tax=Amycolatopsis sp. NPDC059021 TaxID=3346704 RepID=UPI003670BEEB